jgi:hypothetical protein
MQSSEKDLWHTIEIELSQPISVVTRIRFSEPGSGMQHEQEVPSFIPAGTIITGRGRFILKGED